MVDLIKDLIGNVSEGMDIGSTINKESSGLTEDGLIKQFAAIKKSMIDNQAKATAQAEKASGKAKKYQLAGNLLNFAGAAATTINKSIQGLKGKRGIAIGEPASNVASSLLSQGKDAQTSADRYDLRAENNPAMQASLLGTEMRLLNRPDDKRLKEAQIRRMNDMGRQLSATERKEARIQLATVALADFKRRFPDADQEQVLQMMTSTFPDVYSTPTRLNALSDFTKGQFGGTFWGADKISPEMDKWQKQYLGDVAPQANNAVNDNTNDDIPKDVVIPKFTNTDDAGLWNRANPGYENEVGKYFLANPQYAKRKSSAQNVLTK